MIMWHIDNDNDNDNVQQNCTHKHLEFQKNCSFHKFAMMLSGFEIFPTIVGPGYLAHFPHWHIPYIFFFKMIMYPSVPMAYFSPKYLCISIFPQWHIPTHLEKVAREICTLVPRGGWIAFLRDYWHIFLFKNMRPPSQRLLSKKRLKWPLFSVCQIELKQKSSI